MPTHIQTCPSKTQIEGYVKKFEAVVKPEDRAKYVRELIVVLRKSELKNNRCLQQALAYYDKVRAQAGSR